VKRALLWAIAAVAAMGCGSGAGAQIAGAAITTGVAVAAAAVNRAATKDCWAMCPQGKRCDRASGLCVPVPERPVGLPGAPGAGELDARDVGDAGDAPLAPDCRGLCFRGEMCISRAGVPECVPIPDGGAAESGAPDAGAPDSGAPDGG
jgi:hypothetical protein